MKNLIDAYFAHHYGLLREVSIDETVVQEPQFDLLDQNPYLFPVGDGYASFENADENEIHIIEYEAYIQKYAGTKFENGRRRCDFVLHDPVSSTVILNEITSSGEGFDELKKPIFKNNKRTGELMTVFAGGKFEKAEIQLWVSLQTMDDIPEIHTFFDGLSRKICLCSYKLYNNSDLAVIGDPVSAFNNGQTMIERETGETGAIISCPEIENLGFEYRRISHDYLFKIN